MSSPLRAAGQKPTTALAVTHFSSTILLSISLASKIKKISQNALRISSSNKKYTKKRFINLKKKISDLTNNIDSNKFEHEVAMLVLKHDVAEEIERIKFHCSSSQKEITSKKTS